MTHKILMIRPVNFGYNVETAEDNTFQAQPNVTALTTVQSKALVEFDTFVAKLSSIGLDILVIDDTPDPPTPDSIYPNNWISTHSDGTVCLYPMRARNRRSERKPGVLDTIHKDFNVSRTINWTKYEDHGLFLEGTGSMVLDRSNRIVYASRSGRTSEAVLDEFASIMDYTKVLFESYSDDTLIYHTNVMMCIGDQFSVICLEAIRDPEEKERVQEYLQGSGKEIVEITVSQMNSFAGNMLQVQNPSGVKYLVMSTTAYESLTSHQVTSLSKFCQLIHSDLRTVEGGGGSARCMMAEIYLDPKM